MENPSKLPNGYTDVTLELSHAFVGVCSEHIIILVVGTAQDTEFAFFVGIRFSKLYNLTSICVQIKIHPAISHFTLLLHSPIFIFKVF